MRLNHNQITQQLRHTFRRHCTAAIGATAYKIARIVYRLLATREPYREESAAEYDRKRRERELEQLPRRAQKVGFTLTPAPTPAPATQPEPSPGSSF